MSQLVRSSVYFMLLYRSNRVIGNRGAQLSGKRVVTEPPPSSASRAFAYIYICYSGAGTYEVIENR